MTDDSTFDRRSFLRRASGAGLAGFSGLTGFGFRARGVDESETTGGLADADQRRDTSEDRDQTGAIDYFEAVLPVGDVLRSDLLYRIVAVGDPIQPGVRPPPRCFPEEEKQWRARDALVVKPTETTGLFGDGDGIGAVNRTRVHLERPVEPRTLYRISGGEYCGDHATVTVHELPERLREYTEKERIVSFFEDSSNSETTGNGTAGN
ncbi:hypothetical protein [Halorussus salinus]|uniref:hypothetical protein n=1 Tax=Halorussus salinus TaxID=1364935 RepID=UPI0010931014|nr:hypothetical protein [Halorussus salinus]